MSATELKNEVEQLLQQLNVEALFRSHNSVSISYKQMLLFIDKAIEPSPPIDAGVTAAGMPYSRT